MPMNDEPRRPEQRGPHATHCYGCGVPLSQSAGTHLTVANNLVCDGCQQDYTVVCCPRNDDEAEARLQRELNASVLRRWRGR